MKKMLNMILAAFLLFGCGFTQSMQVHADDSLLNDITSDYAYVIDYDTNQVLAEKNADEKMYPASMTKIMTVLVAIENLPDLDQTIQITSAMLEGLTESNASVAGFQQGDQPTVLDLLYGSALPSGADASNALAFTVAGSVDNFVTMMNTKAQELGLNNTHFANATGLHDDDHYSTVKDIATLLHYGIQNSTFAQIFSTASYTTTSLNSAPGGLTLTSTVKNPTNLRNYDIEEMIGAKSGFTYEAGHCLASWEQVNDMNIIAVTAHSDSSISASTHIADLSMILEGLRQMQKTTVMNAGNQLKTITYHYLFSQKEATVTVPEDFTIDAASDASLTVETNLPDQIDITNDEQTLPYTITISNHGEIIQELQYTYTVPADHNFFTRILRSIHNLFQ